MPNPDPGTPVPPPVDPLPIDEALACPRCHHEVVLAIDGAPVCSSYATNWCGWELSEHRDPRRARTLLLASQIGAIRQVDY